VVKFFKNKILDNCLLMNKEEILANIYCDTCKKKYCQNCNKLLHYSTKILHTTLNIEEDISINNYICFEHNKIFKLLCLGCEDLLCSECFFSNNIHDNHEIIKLYNFNNNKTENNKEEKESDKIITKINNNNMKIIDKKLFIHQNKINNIIEKELNYKTKLFNLNNEKQNLLLEFQKLLNFKYISEEKPKQFLLNYKKLIKNINSNNEIDKIYGFGLNHEGQLGKINYLFLGLKDNNNRNIPKDINFFEGLEIKKIYCGNDHSIALSSNKLIKITLESGKLYGFGSNKYGQLGLKKDNNNEYYFPHEIIFFQKIKIINIACGSDHTIVLTGNKFIL
jgi:hypothetical protein